MPDEQLLKLPEVAKITKRSERAITRDVRDGTFPEPLRIGRRAIAWRSTAIQRWIDQLPSARAQA